MNRQPPKPLELASLPRHLDTAEAEQRWDERWQRDGTNHWDAADTEHETYVVDTPPLTVSGSLHTRLLGPMSLASRFPTASASR